MAPKGNWSHLALHVPDFEKKLEIIEDMRLKTMKIIMPNGYRLCFFTDSVEHTIELKEKSFT